MEQQELVKLIQKYLKPHKRVCPFSSYGLKHLFERLAGCYISNNEFKQAMLGAGIAPYKADGENHRYKVCVMDVPEIPTEFAQKGG